MLRTEDHDSRRSFLLTGTKLNRSKGSLLCFAQFMEREIARKDRSKIGWKMAMPLITQTKRNDKVNKTMGIAVGLDK